MSDILSYVFADKNKKKIIPIYNQNIDPTVEQPVPCLSNQDCIDINETRQMERTVYKTITVGLELPNSEGQLIRFLPREVTFIVFQG